ncbi:hypothetical protein DFH07DRAFT_775407 [Mycena maculata]|uniref:AMP-binding enzyme C-terminal domain-containing protein n=1 Tax=Mycena maculata TaxID=230809 RepID=A0AAD7N826_9AGAR|nr:hypothetical protein DFH07DRAFT_775407 [Mycena maculata]
MTGSALGRPRVWCFVTQNDIRITRLNFVRNCTVIGHYKLAVILFIEAVSDSMTPDDVLKLKDEVLPRTAAFNSALFPHERIVDREYIVVVPSGVLPRTKEKGNIRRKAVEEDYVGILE